MLPDQERFNAAIARFDALNSEDPHTEVYNGKMYPKELLYALRMTEWLLKVEPQPSEALQLAIRSQHLRRWTIPRSEYPMDLAGYNKWRNTLRKFHADLAGQVLQEVGYSAETMDRVQFLILKRQLKIDAEVQLLEDVVCLVFLENYFLDFARQHDEEKVIDIVQKTWRKMTPRGQEIALTLPMLPEAARLVTKALAG
ncbi:DUF4202 domain-containing protein [Adhaeribacter pallidiroseus]|uniref:tRNA(Thr) (Cytosine(32)-N(3))-methyltransferase n=1 Tax=Adhaeribacter pallidiroseus TaxID=2072847 RepID=A0A369QDM3_9BACT|nr:DUF4202 domain-containing protein [Adhaeribacter pallidiroseus]RDC63023.1 tRNA(Thr) (cytosine(32)-N(3))-methyltransferase [Adhaeribacter pallidiroseus]